MFFKRKERTVSEEILIKSSAYDALIDQGVHMLPVFTPQNDVIIVFPMQYLEEKPIHCDILNHDGVIMSLGSEGSKRYVLMYDQELSLSARNWTVFKLLYYVKSGIADKYPKSYIDCDSLPESEIFAAHYACPDVILENCQILQSDDIMHHCEIPFDAAHRKSRYLKEGHGHFPFTSLERMVKDNFKEFTDKFQ